MHIIKPTDKALNTNYMQDLELSMGALGLLEVIVKIGDEIHPTLENLPNYSSDSIETINKIVKELMDKNYIEIILK